MFFLDGYDNIIRFLTQQLHPRFFRIRLKMFFLLNIRLKCFTLPNTLQKFSNIFRLFFSLVFCECRQPGAVLSTARGPVVFTNVVLRVAYHGGSRHWETHIAGRCWGRNGNVHLWGTTRGRRARRAVCV